MIINIVLTTICHSLCAAASIIFFIAAVMSGWDTGETMFTFMFLGIIQGAVISSLGLLALRSRGFLSSWRSSLLATASYIAGTSFLTPVGPRSLKVPAKAVQDSRCRAPAGAAVPSG